MFVVTYVAEGQMAIDATCFDGMYGRMQITKHLCF